MFIEVRPPKLAYAHFRFNDMEPSRTRNGGYEGAKMKMCLDPNGEHHVTKRKITR